MGIINFLNKLISKRKYKKVLYRKVHYKKPLYRKGGRTYWKGIPVDDEEFSALMQNNPNEIRKYNRIVKITNHRIRKRNNRVKYGFRKK